VIHAAEVFTTENKILRHENNGLRNAIKEEKRRRRRGKPLELMDEDDIFGQALFFSPAKVERARQRFHQQKEAEEQEKQFRADKRLQQAITRSEKQREKEERRIALMA
jgi:hypothetical protein